MPLRRLFALVALIGVVQGEAAAQEATSVFDAAALQRLLRSAEAAHSDAIVLWKDGRQVGAWYFGKQPKKIEAMSATKSIVNLAIGRLVTTGAIASIDDLVSKYYPEWRQGLKRAITIRQLLNHTSGLLNGASQEVELSPDVVKLALAAELSDPPGTHFYYNNKAVNLLAGIVQRASGRKMDDVMRNDIFAPLGITDVEWKRDSAGNPFGYARLEIFPADMAKLGQLVLNRGRWNGRQLISAKWFDAIQQGSALEPRAGLLWWLLPAHTTWIIDDARIAALRAAGGDTAILRSVAGIRGRYESRDSFIGALKRALGETYSEAYGAIHSATRMDIDRREYGQMIGLEANGSFGQYIVVYPDQHVVAVRMVAVSDKFDLNTDSFENFRDLVRALVPH